MLVGMIAAASGAPMTPRDQETTRIEFAVVGAADLPLISRWLQRPHVARWFHTAQEWLDEIRDGLAADWRQQLLVSIDGRPAGYAQCCDCDRAPVGMWSGCPAGTWGIDLFIGESEFLGRGLSRTVMRHLIARCWQDPCIRWLTVDPEEDNPVALRVFRYAGFRPVPGIPGLWLLPRP